MKTSKHLKFLTVIYFLIVVPVPYILITTTTLSVQVFTIFTALILGVFSHLVIARDIIAFKTNKMFSLITILWCLDLFLYTISKILFFIFYIFSWLLLAPYFITPLILFFVLISFIIKKPYYLKIVNNRLLTIVGIIGTIWVVLSIILVFFFPEI